MTLAFFPLADYQRALTGSVKRYRSVTRAFSPDFHCQRRSKHALAEADLTIIQLPMYPILIDHALTTLDLRRSYQSARKRGSDAYLMTRRIMLR